MQMVLENIDAEEEEDSSDSAESEDGIQYLDELDDAAIDDLMEQMHDAPLGM